MADANKKNQDYLLYANYSRFFSTSLLSVTQKMWCYNSVQYIHFQPVFLTYSTIQQIASLGLYWLVIKNIHIILRILCDTNLKEIRYKSITIKARKTHQC